MDDNKVKNIIDEMSSDEDEVDNDDLKTSSINIIECLETQLTEVEMIQSMFSNPGEFNMFDKTILNNIQNFIDKKTLVFPNHIDFTINLVIENNIKLEICIHLPHKYPYTEPDVFVRSNELTRTNQTNLNVKLNEYIKSIERSIMCLYTVVNWIQENALSYTIPDTKDDQNKATTKKLNQNFSRYWIYSHHIYSKIKRKTMIDLSADLNITGFCLPGKPGIVCIEGSSDNCEDWWHRIRSMTWKKILCKKIEEIKLDSNTADNNIDINRKFDTFKEISFLNSKNNSGKQDYHMDMGEFNKFLIEKQCGYMFKEYFGFEGKS